MDFITQHILTLISTSGGVVPAFIDYLSVIAGVLTGALVACDRKLDIIGVTVLGLVTGYGGGMFRDFLLQSHGVYFMAHPYLLLAAIALCVVVFFFRQIFDRIDYGVFVADALSAYGAQDTLAAVLCVVCVVMLRCLSVRFNWKTGSDKLMHRH